MTAGTMDRGLRLAELTERLGMSRSWVYDAIARGAFPRPVKIGARASVWLESEVTEFLVARARERDGVAETGEAA